MNKGNKFRCKILDASDAVVCFTAISYLRVTCMFLTQI